MSTYNMFSGEIKEYRYLFVVKSTIPSTVAIFTLRIQTDRSNKQQTPLIYRISLHCLALIKQFLDTSTGRKMDLFKF